MKKILPLLLCFVLAFALASCAPSYEGDGRIGAYTDRETGCYTLVLNADGTGVITHASSTVPETREDVFFEIRDGSLFVNGKSKNGAVIGQIEYYGAITETADGYTVPLKSDVTGITLGTFYKKK